MSSPVYLENPRRTLCLCAAAALCFLLPAAQVNAQVVSAPAHVALQSLHIDILEGEGALNNIRQRDAREPAVQVTDENHKPVAGAVILFTIHTGPQGAGATFGGQSLTFSATTGSDGIARASTLHLTKSPGTYTIEVAATIGTLVANAIIHQSNVIGALGSSNSNVTNSATVHHTVLGMSKTVAITVGSVVIVGVVIGVVQATKSSGTSLTLGGSNIGP